METNSTMIAQLYIGYFGRAPDPNGYSHYMQQMANGRSIEEIAKEFANSREAKELYPYLVDPNSFANVDRFVDQIYMNLFGRAADSGGRAYYKAGLEAAENAPNHISADQFILAIIKGRRDSLDGAEGSPDRTILDNRAAVAIDFTESFNDAESPDGYKIQWDELDAGRVSQTIIDSVGGSTVEQVMASLVATDKKIDKLISNLENPKWQTDGTATDTEVGKAQLAGFRQTEFENSGITIEAVDYRIDTETLLVADSITIEFDDVITSGEDPHAVVINLVGGSNLTKATIKGTIAEDIVFDWIDELETDPNLEEFQLTKSDIALRVDVSAASELTELKFDLEGPREPVDQYMVVHLIGLGEAFTTLDASESTGNLYFFEELRSRGDFALVPEIPDAESPRTKESSNPFLNLDHSLNFIGSSGGDFLLILPGNVNDDTLNGGGGDEVFFAGDGNDILIGGIGEDWLSGGRGDDRITGGSGADILTGGGGADTFVFAQGDSKDWDEITDFTVADTGGDQLMFSVAGNEDNYFHIDDEEEGQDYSMAEALALAERNFGNDDSLIFVFVERAGQYEGALFIDYDDDNEVDDTIVFSGGTAIWDFSYEDIVAAGA